MFGYLNRKSAARIEDMEKQLRYANQRIEELERDARELEHEASEEAYQHYDSTVEDTKQEIVELKKQLATKENTANVKSRQSLASIGVTTVFPPEERISVPITPNMELLNTFDSLQQGEEKNEYYKKNKAQIDRALSLQLSQAV